MSAHRPCSQLLRLPRRGVVQAGALSAFGFGLTELFQAQAAQGAGRTAPADSVLLMWLSGGPSHQDLWDMKPAAPAEVRGEFRPIPSSVPGLEVSELLPRVAKRMHQMALVRGLTHARGDHQGAQVWQMTGYKPTRAQFALLDPSQDQPSMGSVVTQELGPRTQLPPYVCVPNADCNGQWQSFLPPGTAPFCVKGDPNKPDFEVRDLGRLAAGSPERLDRRRRLLDGTPGRFRDFERTVASLDSWNANFARAYDLVGAARARDAFDIRKESNEVRDRYGRNVLGQSTLMARRLLEQGVRFVTVDTWYHMDWDTHSNNFKTLKDSFAPRLDAALSALLEDFERNEALSRTLLVIMSEFGRTPKVNKDAGRDHWAPCNVVLFAGAGIRAGQVLGASDAEAAYPEGTAYSPEQMVATIYTLLGLDLDREFVDQQSRPWKIATGKPVGELMARSVG